MLNSRQYNLILSLASEDKYLPAKHYSQLFSVSEKTIYNDIDKINDYLLKYDILVDKIPRKGVLLISNSIQKKLMVKEVLQELTEVNLNYHLKLQLLKKNFLSKREKDLSLEKLSQKYYVSYSTMYNEWSDLIEGIDYFELKIKNGTSLQGDEHNVQRWIVQALKKELQLYELSNNNMYKIFVDRIFDEKTVELVSKLVKQLEKINPDLYYTNYFDSIALSLLVFVQRKMIGCSMTSNIQDILTLPMLASYQIAITISEEIYKESEIILNQYDIEYISFLLFTHKILPSKDSNIGNENIHVLTKKLISNLEDLSSIEFEDEELFHSLRSHIGPMIYRLRAGILVTNPLKDEIKESYPVLFSLVRLAVNDIEKQYRIIISDDEIAFLTIYFQTAIEKKVIRKKIAIVCPQGYTTSNLIYNKIYSMLPANYDLQLMDFSSADRLSEHDVEFIISPVEYEHSELEVIKINPVMSISDIDQIIHHVSKNNSVIIDSSLKDTAEISLDNFEEKIFVHILDDKSKENVFEFIGDYLLKENLVSDLFFESVEERERMGSTVLSTNVAIPHGDPQHVHETNIVVCKIPKGLKWNEHEKVKLIVMPNISRTDFPIAKMIMGSLFKVILDDEKVSRIMKTDDREEIKRLIVQEG